MTDDISDLFAEDEASFPLEITGRKDGKPVPTGVVYRIRDLQNLDTQKELKRERNKALGRRITKKEDLSDEEIGAMMSIATTDPTDAMLAHCVTGWDWGDKKLGNISTKFAHDNVVKSFEKAPWIRAQVLAKAIEITDFTKA